MTSVFDLIIGAYVTIYNRAAEPKGTLYWANELGYPTIGAALSAEGSWLLADQLGRKFYAASSKVFDATYPSSMANDDFIENLYVNLGGRGADANGAAFWLDRLNDLLLEASTPPQVARAMVAAEIAFALQTYDPNATGDARIRADTYKNKVAVSRATALSGNSSFDPKGQGMDDLAYAGLTKVLHCVDETTASKNFALKLVSAANVANDPSLMIGVETLAASVSEVKEGSSIVFTFQTKDVPAGTKLTYVLSGVQAADVVGGSLTGQVAVDVHGKALVTVGLTADSLVEGDETLTMTVACDTASVVVKDVVDRSAPKLVSAIINGNELVLTYDEALDQSNIAEPSLFSVFVNEKVVSLNASTPVAVKGAEVKLKLATAVKYGDVIKVSYSDPTDQDDAKATQDLEGNDAASLSKYSVDNNTADNVRPKIIKATIDGDNLVLSYDEALDSARIAGASAFSVYVNGEEVALQSKTPVSVSGSDVSLKLAAPVEIGDQVKVDYFDPTALDDGNATQDLVGNDADSLNNYTVINNTADQTAPKFVSATIVGDELTMTYDEPLDSNDIAEPSLFSVFVGGNKVDLATTEPVSVNGADVLLKLATAVKSGDEVTVTYTDPTRLNDPKVTQDLAGNDAASLTNQGVINETDDSGPGTYYFSVGSEGVWEENPESANGILDGDEKIFSTETSDLAGC